MFKNQKIHNLYSILYTELKDKSDYGIINVMFEIDFLCFNKFGKSLTKFIYEKNCNTKSVYLYDLKDLDFFDQLYVKNIIDYDLFSKSEIKIINDIINHYRNIEHINYLSEKILKIINKINYPIEKHNNDEFIIIDFNETL